MRNAYGDYQNDVNTGKRLVWWVIGVMTIVSMIGFVMSRTVATVDAGIIHYEEFQEIYNTCNKINADLGTVRAVPEADKMFDAFSKQAQIAQKRQQLTRWIEEYNAKSKMINRSLWKSRALPYQLDINQFSNYEVAR